MARQHSFTFHFPLPARLNFCQARQTIRLRCQCARMLAGASIKRRRGPAFAAQINSQPRFGPPPGQLNGSVPPSLRLNRDLVIHTCFSKPANTTRVTPSPLPPSPTSFHIPVMAHDSATTLRCPRINILKREISSTQPPFDASPAALFKALPLRFPLRLTHCSASIPDACPMRPHAHRAIGGYTWLQSGSSQSDIRTRGRNSEVASPSPVPTFSLNRRELLAYIPSYPICKSRSRYSFQIDISGLTRPTSCHHSRTFLQLFILTSDPAAEFDMSAGYTLGNPSSSSAQRPFTCPTLICYSPLHHH